MRYDSDMLYAIYDVKSYHICVTGCMYACVLHMFKSLGEYSEFMLLRLRQNLCAEILCDFEEVAASERHALTRAVLLKQYNCRQSLSMPCGESVSPTTSPTSNRSRVSVSGTSNTVKSQPGGQFLLERASRASVL